MKQIDAASQLLPDLLSTQLLAADVYAVFLRRSEEPYERELWRHLLLEEFAHIRFVGLLLESDRPPETPLPAVRLDAFREIHDRALQFAGDSPYERALWALRLEHAEIDFGVEAMAVEALGRDPSSPVFAGTVEEHYDRILRYAARFQGAREISLQIARIREHFPRLGGDQAGGGSGEIS